jgi:hypothetical protein
MGTGLRTSDGGLSPDSVSKGTSRNSPTEIEAESGLEFPFLWSSMKIYWGCFLIAFALVGCGGGGGSSQSTPEEPAGAEFAFGTLSGRAASTNPPLTTNSNKIAATALTGIITSLRLRDQQLEPGEGRLVFTIQPSPTGNRDIYSSNLDSTDLVQITSTPGVDEIWSTVSPDGKKVAFQAVGIGGDQEIFVMNLDGSGRVQLTENNVNDFRPRWAPTSTSLTYYDTTGDVYAINVSTKAITPIAVDQYFNKHPVFSPDGQSVIFVSYNREGDEQHHLYRTSSSGGGADFLYYSGAPAFEEYPGFSQDGTFNTFMRAGTVYYRPFEGRYEPFLVDVQQGMEVFSPDSKRVAYTSIDDLFAEFGYLRIYFRDVEGGPVTELFPDLNTVDFEYPSYVPAPKEVIFVGGPSLFGSRLSGFVFSQAGPNVKALLGFDATTPTSAVVTKQTPNDTVSPNLVYSIDADTVTDISYAHAPYWKPTKVVGGGTNIGTADGALVSIDSATGKIVAVLPFSGARSDKAGYRDDGGIRVFTGNFLGVFDGSGKNLGSASEVRVNVLTGEIQAL